MSKPVLLVYGIPGLKGLLQMVLPEYEIEETGYYHVNTPEALIGLITRREAPPAVFFCDFGPAEDPASTATIRAFRLIVSDLPLVVFTPHNKFGEIAEDNRASYYCTNHQGPFKVDELEAAIYKAKLLVA